MASYKTKVCPVCGNEFETMFWNKKYCGTECADKARRVRCAEYYRKKTGRPWTGRTLEETKTCAMCGAKFKPRHWNQKYCGGECSRLADNRDRKTYRERHPEKEAQWRENAKEKRLKRAREYREKNREKINERDRLRRKYGKDWVKWREEVSEASEPEKAKSKICDFEGSCFECPYPDCVES